MSEIAQAGAFVPTEAMREEMARRLADAAFAYAAQVMDSFAIEQARLCREECERLRAAALAPKEQGNAG